MANCIIVDKRLLHICKLGLESLFYLMYICKLGLISLFIVDND